LVEKEGAERLYFVIETKSSLFDETLRDAEKHKIQCGKAHFSALDTQVVFARSNGHEHFQTLI
jgi:type III restriction enzyme